MDVIEINREIEEKERKRKEEALEKLLDIAAQAAFQATQTQTSFPKVMFEKKLAIAKTVMAMTQMGFCEAKDFTERWCKSFHSFDEDE